MVERQLRSAHQCLSSHATTCDVADYIFGRKITLAFIDRMLLTKTVETSAVLLSEAVDLNSRSGTKDTSLNSVLLRRSGKSMNFLSSRSMH